MGLNDPREAFKITLQETSRKATDLKNGGHRFQLQVLFGCPSSDRGRLQSPRKKMRKIGGGVCQKKKERRSAREAAVKDEIYKVFGKNVGIELNKSKDLKKRYQKKNCPYVARVETGRNSPAGKKPLAYSCGNQRKGREKERKVLSRADRIRLAKKKGQRVVRVPVKRRDARGGGKRIAAKKAGLVCRRRKRGRG